MTGRGIDQVLPHPSPQQIYESYMKDARGYVTIAESVNGPIKKPVPFNYIWGDALEELKRIAPDLRLINLETSVTKSEGYWKGKGINYRMNPDNIKCITEAGIDHCSLANNHVLDWGYDGLEETLKTLKKAGLKYSGAGSNRDEAEQPVIIEIAQKGRVIIFSFGLPSSGIPYNWGATEKEGGVFLVADTSNRSISRIKEKVQANKRKGDVAVASIHWGDNWGYCIDSRDVEFAHKLIDKAGIDLVYGHSSHHPKPMEVYRGRLIIYGCGDFINDYEGISGYEEFRDDLTLMYFPSIDPETGALVSLKMIPLQIKNFSLHRASREDTQWLQTVLNREGTHLKTALKVQNDNTLILQWD